MWAVSIAIWMQPSPMQPAEEVREREILCITD